MKHLVLLILTCLAISLTAQQSLKSFERINVSGKVDVTLTKGTDLSYEILDGTDELKVKVEQGMLKISRQKLFNDWDKPVRIHVTYDILRSIYASAGASVEHDGTLDAGDFEVSFDTGASGDLIIDAQSVDARVGEGGILRLEGSARSLEASSVTGGVLKAGDFTAEKVYVKSNTGGVATVHATQLIEATATLGGSVIYSGNPEQEKVKETLGGSVKG